MRARDPGEFSARDWPDWGFLRDGPPERVVRSRVVGAVVNAVVLVALLPLVLDVVRGRHGGPLVVVLGAVACYGAGYVLAAWCGPGWSRRPRVAIVVTLVVLGLVPAVLLRSPHLLTGMTFALAIGLMLLPLRWSLPLGVVVPAGQIVWMRLAGGRVEWGEVAALVGVTAALGAFVALTFTIGHLRAAREQVAVLAVARERERVARDLHDVLGHSLSTMTVKLGLARRLLESSGDVERAGTEIRELEGLSRQVLSDVRATVSDHRTVTLAAEIAGARAALHAAGMRADLPRAVDDVDPELRTVFGYAVREAVTNVLRHSAATCCRIRLGRDWVEITDDGRSAAEQAPDGGHGLPGLAERLAAVSGTVEHGRRPGGGFRVLARGPVATPEPSRVEAGPA